MTDVPAWVKRVKAGDEVVCIDKSPPSNLVYRGVYKVKFVFAGFRADNRRDIGFALAEVGAPNPWARGYVWDIFRPADRSNRPTDISIFKELLDQSPALEDA